ncbi:MAG: glycosyltransferase [Nitrospiraceae bacterium]|nr:MAG: glycosyltransferase [Nitrospiraceae bacterium]
MKILIVNNYFYNRGGDCTYMFSLKKLLKKNGHNVVIFSMNHPDNYDCEYSDHFVSYINYAEEIKDKKLSSAVKVIKRTVYSTEARQKIEALIQKEKPDIAHLQNIHHHITPSILYVLRKYNIPIVWTLHDYTIICPNTSFLAKGLICERCKKRKFYWPMITRCKKESFSASTMAAFETIIHRMMGVYKLVDIFIAPSMFLRNKFIEYGFNENKIIHIDHFIDFPVIEDNVSPEDYYFFVGRITQEKGVKTLIDAAINVNLSHLKIAGGGPFMNELVAYTRRRDKNNIVEFLGHLSREDLFDLYRNSRFVIVPSEWYENSGLTIFEAFACGKPVIGANIGGIPELIKDHVRGLIFRSGDAEALSFSIMHMLKNPDHVRLMGDNAKDYIKNHLNGETHYRKLLNTYMEALSSH